MSSDDEDELLQMALKEQAERDLNYRKASSSSSSSSKPSRPVVNLVQPPTAPTKNRGGKPPTSAPPGKVKGKPSMDDEDSDVEMLSISSGDESPPPAAAVKRTVGGGGGKEEMRDRGWDGQEPNCWKRVDEAELGRRVREMRETRSTAVVVEQKPSGPKALTTIQSMSRGFEFIDPLGIGLIDAKSLTMMSETGEARLAGSKETLDQAAREKLMYFSEKFDAKMFLSRIHEDTSAADLEAGGLALKTDLRGRTQQKKLLVKNNFDCFVSCKTTIDDIQSKLKGIEDDPEGAGTAYLTKCIEDVMSVARQALEPLFERQAQAEKIRSVQGMLQRFRTLFNLPSAIRANISKKEYDLAVREYRKAKSIVLPSHAGILKRVLEEVEKVMHEFKGMLYSSMEDPQINLADLENIVRLLLELEPDSDPVWHYLSIQNNKIQGLLEGCTSDHDVRMEALQTQLREKVILDERWRKIHQDSNKSSPVNFSILLGDKHATADTTMDLGGEEVDALRDRYIRRLTAVVAHHIPSFWKLAVSIFNGKFTKSSQVTGAGAHEAEANGNIQVQSKSDKSGEMKYSSHSLDEVADLILGTLAFYEAKVQSTFHDLEESNILRRYMRNAIKEVSKACQAMEVKETVPASVVKYMIDLHLELLKTYITRLCTWMRVATGELSKDDLWVPMSILERSRSSSYTVSLLPSAFQSMVMSAMDQIVMMFQNLRSGTFKSNSIFLQVQEMQESVRLSFLNCFLDFAGHLERVGSEISQNRGKDSRKIPNGIGTDFIGRPSGPQQPVNDFQKKILIVLSNIGYCKDHLCPELYNKYKHIWMHSREKDVDDDSDIRELVLSFSALEEKVLAHYTYAKSNLIRVSATNYLLNSGVQWGAAPPVKGMRDATVELLHTLVAVHAEVFSGAKPLLEKTLSVLVEGLVDTLLSVFHENKAADLRAFDANGFCQLMLELEYFETVLHAYITPEARELLKSLQGLLLETTTESMAETLETPAHSRRAARSDDLNFEDRQQRQAVSPDELIALAQQCTADFLQVELERTRLNTACFMESSSLPLDSMPENAKAVYSSFRTPVDSPRRTPKASQYMNSPSAGRHRRRVF